MSAAAHPLPPALNRAIVFAGLAVIGFGLTLLLGLAALFVPLGCLGMWIYTRVRSDWAWLGFSPRGTRRLFGWLALVTLVGALIAGGNAVQRQQEAAARHIVAVDRAAPADAKALLAAADEGTLQHLKQIAPSLEAAERSRRAAKVAADEKARNDAAAAAAERLEQNNREKIAVDLARVKTLARDDLDGRIAVYEDLTSLAPARDTFATTLTELKAKRDRLAEMRAHPERGLKLVTFAWRKEGFGTIMMLTATVRNESPIALKDFTITCDHSAPSGTVIDHNTQTVYERIDAGKVRRFRDINMGFIRSQSSRSACAITGAAAA